jgi:hypothetical protein
MAFAFYRPHLVVAELPIRGTRRANIRFRVASVGALTPGTALTLVGSYFLSKVIGARHFGRDQRPARHSCGTARGIPAGGSYALRIVHAGQRQQFRPRRIGTIPTRA